jgi:dTDP-4-dehydrorhamnose 3,5-epimerase
MIINNLNTTIEGLVFIEPKVFKDERGCFYESWRENNYKQYGIIENFVQDNISVSKKNVLRGLHYQHNQGQMITVIQGKIFDVIVDIRPTSPTFKQHIFVELSEDKPLQIYMSPGLAHGFFVLSDQAVIMYKCTQYYNSCEEGGIAWNDPDLNIKWPSPSIILSDRDKSHPRLMDIL